MNGLLVRVGIDQVYGRWNAPVNPGTREFVYVPVPEDGIVLPGLSRRYGEFAPALEAFGSALPSWLNKGSYKFTHLDPDFSELTYGDGWPRSKPIEDLGRDDFLAFYAGLEPPNRQPGGLLYALIGFYVIDEVVRVRDVPRERWRQNAHTRRQCNDPMAEIVVRARPVVSGRLERCIPIGEYRDNAYRVRPDVLDAWGGLSVKDGYLQRSGRLPSFPVPERFYAWFKKQQPTLVRKNNW